MTNVINNASIRGGFADKPIAKLARSLFPAFARLAPNTAANLALKLFLTPPRVRAPSWEGPYMSSATTGTLSVHEKSFNTYTWGTGEQTILMCHSWGGRSTQLANFIKPLNERGFRVIGFDAPAHGKSTGKQTDMMEYSAAVNAVVSHFGPIHGILGHSFGAGNSLFAWHRFGFDVTKMVLIGSFSNAIWVTERFGEILGISKEIIANMRRALEHRYGGELNWASLDIGRFAKSFPGEILIIHDRDDHEIPYSNAENIVSTANRQGIELMSTGGMGHRRILRDKQVISRVSDFFLYQT